jgi:bifunctional non-homologous end joining protein LigD
MSDRVRSDGYVSPCIPTLVAKPPTGPDWVHEIKHDGYRLIVRRDRDVVRLFTRRAVTERYPTITRAAFGIRARSFRLDGEAIVCGADGIAAFDARRRHGPVPTAVMKAFDLLELDGKDLRRLPRSAIMRQCGGASQSGCVALAEGPSDPTLHGLAGSI